MKYLYKKPAEGLKNQLAVFTLFHRWVHKGVGVGAEGGVVVIVTPSCFQRPPAPCGRVAMGMAGCSVGVLW